MENTMSKDTENQMDKFLVGTGETEKLFFVEYFMRRRDFKIFQAADVWECIWKFAEWSGLVNPISCQYLGDEHCARFRDLVEYHAPLADICALTKAHSYCQLQHIFAATQII